MCPCSFTSKIPSRGSLILKLETNACQGTETEVNYLEHVQAVITLNSTRRGDIVMFMNSPMGTRYTQCLTFHSSPAYLINYVV